jgi:hypothetical protein
MVLQAFLTGAVTAQAAAMLTAAPFDAVVCHGAGGEGSSAPAAPSVPDADKVWKLCCVFCASASPAMVALDMPDVPPILSWKQAALPALTSLAFIVSYCAIRAGFSQAPPGAA